MRELGARPAVADALDADAVARAVSEAVPEAIVHQLTALGGDFDIRHFDRTFAQTNRLRTEGTDNLLAAAAAAGTRRFLTQSYAGLPIARQGPPVQGEDAPYDPDPPAPIRAATTAIRHLEQAVTGAPGIEGVVLRYGGFYGPGTSVATDPDSEQIEAIRKRRFPIVGGGAGVWSFVHVADAAEATAIALEHATPGIYNVVDDGTAPVREWLPAVAAALGARPPRKLPRWLGRLAAGEAAVTLMTEARGASNAKAKAELGWRPQHATLWDSLAAGAV